jgi:hypothetical protein
MRRKATTYPTGLPHQIASPTITTACTHTDATDTALRHEGMARR